jgi:transposase-like protein
MAKQEFSIPALSKRLVTEADAYLLLEELRWNGQPEACPNCGEVGRCYYLNPTNGVSRKTRTGAVSQRRVWKCGGCRKQFSVLTGTIFQGTKVSVRTWLFVVFEMCASKNGVSAREIERKYDLTPKTAWFMLHRIREAMKLQPLAGLLAGTVQADETWIGGNPKNRHRNDPREKARGDHATNKTPVFSLIHYETRQARSRVVPNVTGATLLPAMIDNLDMPTVWLHTDAAKTYRVAAPHVAAHEFVTHESGEYVRNGVSTNLAEGYFSQLKRSLDGTHHRVSVEHLDRYLAHFDFMYSHCRQTDSQRMRTLIGQVDGRRLTYKPLTGRA